MQLHNRRKTPGSIDPGGPRPHMSLKKTEAEIFLESVVCVIWVGFTSDSQKPIYLLHAGVNAASS